MKKIGENVGKIGELLVSHYLKRRGHRILGMNYRKKWGEIDVISQKGNTIHFIEVKTVSRETLEDGSNSYSPEENVHPEKLKRLHRTIQSYLLEKRDSDDKLWQLDVAGVFLNLDQKKARVRITEDIVV